MPHTNLFTLDTRDVVAIVKSTGNASPVRLVALDCNWGPPVSGRFDTDFLQVWAVAATRLKPKRVSLWGTRDGSGWTIDEELDRVSTEGEVDLFFADLGHPFPTQFVIRMEGEDGSEFYDNNGGYGIDYRLTAYGGRMTSAVVGDGAKTGPGAPNGAVWLLPKFTRYKLIARSE